MSGFLRSDKVVDFMGKRRLFVTFSLVITLAGMIGVFAGPIAGMMGQELAIPIGINWGIDFQSGTKMMLEFEKNADLSKINGVLEDTKRETGVKYRPAQFVKEGTSGAAAASGRSVDIRMGVVSRDQETSFLKNMEEKAGTFTVLKKETVGPIVGKGLMTRALWAVLIASALIFAYIWFKYEAAFSIGAIVALFHDAAVMISSFAFFGFEVNSAFVAAVLVVIGYSVNDTIVIFDRIRENTRLMRRATPEDVFNTSISQTLGRSINTVMTVIIVLLAIAVFGGITLRDFSLALLIGVSTGAYSSICIASVVALRLSRVKRLGGKISNQLAHRGPVPATVAAATGDSVTAEGDAEISTRPAGYQPPASPPGGGAQRQRRR